MAQYSCFWKIGRLAIDFLKKGHLAYIEGKISSRKYLDKQNIEKTAYTIIANELVFLPNSKEGTQEVKSIKSENHQAEEKEFSQNIEENRPS